MSTIDTQRVITYPIKSSPDFWRAVRVKAAQSDKSIHTIVLQLLQGWLDGTFDLQSFSTPEP